LLISPVSWSHHWVWSVPAMLTLVALGRRYHHRLALATATTGFVVFAAAPQWWFPRGANQELRWAVWQQATGSSYVLFAVAVLLLSAPARLTSSARCVAAELRPGPRASTHLPDGAQRSAGL
jgi:alpha-1,2-mannosyltransferase